MKISGNHNQHIWMDIERHVNNWVCKSCFGQNWQIGHIRKYLTMDTTKNLVKPLITPRENNLIVIHCSVVCTRLKNVLNTNACAITTTSRYCCIITSLAMCQIYGSSMKLLPKRTKHCVTNPQSTFKELLHV